MAETNGKIMSARDAISRFVHDGDQLVIGNYTVGSCAELVYEVVRQKKKGFTRKLRICKKITDTKSVRPELVEGQPFMVRQTHHERVTVPLILLQPLR